MQDGDGEKGNATCDKQVGGMDELQMDVGMVNFKRWWDENKLQKMVGWVNFKWMLIK